MSTRQRLLGLVLTITLAGASSLTAQDLAINNVRIIVGTGQVIEQGTIVIRGGRMCQRWPTIPPRQGCARSTAEA